MAKAQRIIRTEAYLENDKVPTRIVAQDDIAQRAYALYLARGGEHGHDVDDWLAAERNSEKKSQTHRRKARDRMSCPRDSEQFQRTDKLELSMG